MRRLDLVAAALGALALSGLTGCSSSADGGGSSASAPADTADTAAIPESTTTASTTVSPSTAAAPDRPSEGPLEPDTDYEVNGTIGLLDVIFHAPASGSPIIVYGPGAFGVLRQDVSETVNDLAVLDLQYLNLAEVDAASGAPVSRTELPDDLLDWLEHNPSLEVVTPRSPITAGDAAGEVLVTRTTGLSTATDDSFCADSPSPPATPSTAAPTTLGCFGLFVADDGSPWITFPGTLTEFAVFHVGPTDVLVMTERVPGDTGPSLLGGLRINAG